jgi:hypothetical protein
MTTAPARRQITRADILDMTEYASVRTGRRRALIEVKAVRRLAVGPVATFYFENYDTMWMQIHEMLRIERGGESQIADELAAYNPLVPNGRELVATVMFEIDDPVRRNAILGTLGGVEHTMTIQFGDERVAGQPEADQERTNARGKTSSVHFIHFPFTEAQIEGFKVPGQQVIVGIGHPHYGHLAILPEITRAALAADFD